MIGNEESEMVRMTKEAYAAGTVGVRKKCCGKCAFRAGSPERSDPYGWEGAVTGWDRGAVFFCHEGVPGHDQQEEGAPLEVCAGYHATRGMTFDQVMGLAHIGERPKTRIAYFEEQANLQQFCEGCQHMAWPDCVEAEGSCSLGHKVDFKLPDSPRDDACGYFNATNRICPGFMPKPEKE
ncbi:MAG: hypothetical protein CMI13_07770 [Oleibacter sp.]|nr:hypothetical protein [Thalassolituus sp.]|tara:strand:- start:104 stop:643 length:540 start_codon:yes stop_codon:yes gene_type:complete